MVAVMKYSIMSVFLASLYLVGCGDSDNDGGKTAPVPTEPKSNENTSVTTLGSNVNVASLSNVAEATFSNEDASSNPIITIKKSKDNSLIEAFNLAKEELDIENGSDYEVTLTSSKPINSNVELEFNVPIELAREENDQNAVVAYIVIDGDEDEPIPNFFPLSSTYISSTQKLNVSIPDWALRTIQDQNTVKLIFKIGLAKAMVDESKEIALILSNSVVLPEVGDEAIETSSYPKLICPIFNSSLTNICKETSRFGYRKPGTIGAGNYHSGIDFSANSTTTLVAAADGVIKKMNPKDGSIEIDIDSGRKKIIYRHLSSFSKKLTNGVQVTGGETVLGVAGGVGTKNNTIHLHFELLNKNEILQCKGSTDQDVQCKYKTVGKIDSFPYFINKLKIVERSPKDLLYPASSREIKIELEGRDKKNNIITTAVENNSIPQGLLRTVTWEVSPESGYTVESDEKDTDKKPLSENSKSVNINLRNKATITTNPLKFGKIIAYWDGLEELEATYDVPAVDYEFSGTYVESGDCERENRVVTGLASLIDAKLPKYLIKTEGYSLEAQIPSTQSKNLNYPDGDGITNENIEFSISFEGISVVGKYVWNRNPPYDPTEFHHCSGSYIYNAPFIKDSE
jgi:murein DD-endopeptidase MepM/ murein hydrolase activator NlpD